MDLAYSSSGKIISKQILNSKRLDNNGTTTINYKNEYYYNDPNNPYGVSVVHDNILNSNYHIYWDVKGNMVSQESPQWGGGKRQLCWTEDNRLENVKDDKIGAYYNYDAPGERNLKLNGGTTNVTQNGSTVNIPVLDQQTLYASSLVTVNDQGYTKHYFEEGKRICSKIGNGRLTNVTAPVTPINGDYSKLLNVLRDNIKKSFSICIGSEPYIQTKDLYTHIIQPNINTTASSEPSFYYHSDHLGSSSYITGDNGQKTQTLAYMPSGEDWVDLKHNSPSYTTPYKFTGKEKDTETGYNYYGARYYTDNLSIFLSTDPMSDKYPSLSSYTYCANNPVMLIDPDGKDWYEAENGKVKWDDRVVNQKNTPKGGNYIGNKDSDILNFYDMNQKGETLTSKQAGVHHDGDKNVYSTYTASNSVSVSVDVGQGEASEHNKDGKVFNGVTYTARGIRSNTSEVETYGGIGQTGGAFIVSYGGKEYKSFFFPEEGQNPNGGEGAFQAKKQIPASDISRSKSLQGFKATGGYNVNTPIGNIPVKTIWGQGLHFEQKWNYKK
jgi:RHS repeat-associated protein